jgi:predicted regulator of Ras-like GTPase activity (Roadblock/LC7/MglB family)/DNA-binding protein Fis
MVSDLETLGQMIRDISKTEEATAHAHERGKIVSDSERFAAIYAEALELGGVKDKATQLLDDAVEQGFVPGKKNTAAIGAAAVFVAYIIVTEESNYKAQKKLVGRLAELAEVSTTTIRKRCSELAEGLMRDRMQGITIEDSEAKELGKHWKELLGEIKTEAYDEVAAVERPLCDAMKEVVKGLNVLKK